MIIIFSDTYIRPFQCLQYLQLDNMGSWIFWIINASAIWLTLAAGKDAKFQRKLPIALFKALMEQPLCETAYADYESCENYMPTNAVIKKSSNELNEYSNSEESNVEKFIEDLMTTPTGIEEKRGGRFRAGCDCQLTSGLIDLGSTSYPRYIRNVTCDEHKRCFQSRAKGFHCHPIHYQVSVITMRNRQIDPSESNDTPVLPRELRCCWKASTIPTVVGCVCGPQNY